MLDIWSLPAKKGTPRNLTRTSGVAEREPSWSPDGKWITYFSDASGEYELVICHADATGKPETVTQMGPGFRYQPAWSPDSKWLAFRDHESKYYVFDVAERKVRNFDRVNIAGWGMGAPSPLRWSRDSQWLTYTRPNADNMSVIMLYNVRTKKRHQVTSGMFVDSLPTFGRKGEFLYFSSAREFSKPEYADAWRFMRDYFYDPNMHRVDWPAVRKQYEALLADCVSRRDVGYVIGMRTWGGVIGIAKNPRLIDGAGITVPFITFYETDGTLCMEGHGVDPDIEVVDDPAEMVDGGDPQLDAAIQLMRKEIKEHPYLPAKRPAYPDRSGMGILEREK